MLGLYIALLDEPGSPVRPSTYAVVTLLEAGRNALQGVKEWPAPLDPAVLHLALTVFFPVPWTPGLAAAMSAAPWDQRQDWGLDSQDMITWGSYDHRFEARGLEDGSWTVTRRERDHMSVPGTPRDDDEMVLLLAGRQRTHAYPFASQTNVPWIRALEEAAAPFRASWSRHSELPYLAVFNSERSRAPPAP